MSRGMSLISACATLKVDVVQPVHQNGGRCRYHPSILAIRNENEVNAFHYLNAVQCNQAAVKAALEIWLLWNYPTESLGNFS